MRVKKIIPLFVVFAMVTSFLSVHAHATYGGGVGRADLWEWTYDLYQAGDTDFNPGGIYGSGAGRDDLSAAYSSYVSDLESDFSTVSFNSSSLPIYYPSWSYTPSATFFTLVNLSSANGGFSVSIYCHKQYGTGGVGIASDPFYLPAGSYTLNFGSFIWNGSEASDLYYYLKCGTAGGGSFPYGSSLNPVNFTVSEAGTVYVDFTYRDLYIFYDETYTFSGSCYVVPLFAPSGVPDATTRPTSISGNYGIIGDDGQLTSVGTQTIVNEGSSTYYNPVTSTTYDLSGWTYDYSTRTYDLSTASGDTITVEYADESVNITEGDTVYNVYYVVEQEPVDPSTCEHTYTCEHTTLPSCTQAGLDTYTCSLCGDTYTQTVAAAGHTWTVKQSVNTQYDETGALVTEGYTIYECSICGEQYKSTDGTAPPNSSGSSSGGTIGGLLESLIGGLGSIVGGLISGLLSLLTKAVEALGGIGDLLSALWDSLGSIFEGFTGFLAVVFPFLPEEFLTILEFGFILLVGAGIIKKFSS